MQKRLAFLERKLDVRTEEIRRRDTIIMNMTEAMKALSPSSQEAPPDERESPQSVDEEPERADRAPLRYDRGSVGHTASLVVA